MESEKQLPIWLIIVSGLFAALEIMVSLSIWFTPETVVEAATLKSNGVIFLTRMWAVRQFALGCIIGFSTWKKSVPMLTLSYIFLLVMFLGDGLVGIVQKEQPLIMAAALMCIISGTILFILQKK